ncbi:hypothetical protein QVD17_26203 [Tagetes erecta]|uniref:Uncharacterized protein n=1 Tax=Tagetes erecta TaxID=13708 RepID=A0AAD8K8Y3_TARER|nr:hypothetical protein QVD17_26203 [Tagetes erecta]
MHQVQKGYELFIFFARHRFVYQVSFHFYLSICNAMQLASNVTCFVIIPLLNHVMYLHVTLVVVNNYINLKFIST